MDLSTDTLINPAAATVAAEPCCINTVGLNLSYGGKQALRNVDLSIRARSITALIGPSGCGKSSFLTALSRLTDLIPCCTVSGVIEIDGKDITNEDVDLLLLHRKVGMIFQRPNPFPFSIRKNITFPLREHGVRDRHVLEERLEKVLLDVGLWDEVRDRLDSPALSLSGGQQQRLCIARALALEPEVLLFDEPCSALDPISSGVVEELIAGLQDRYTVAVVTHNLGQARRIAQYAALFWVREGAGCVVECGPVAQVFEDPKDELTAAYVSGARG